MLSWTSWTLTTWLSAPYRMQSLHCTFLLFLSKCHSYQDYMLPRSGSRSMFSSTPHLSWSYLLYCTYCLHYLKLDRTSKALKTRLGLNERILACGFDGPMPHICYMQPTQYMTWIQCLEHVVKIYLVHYLSTIALVHHPWCLYFILLDNGWQVPEVILPSMSKK